MALLFFISAAIFSRCMRGNSGAALDFPICGISLLALIGLLLRA